MSDFICRTTMARCQTPGMCSPHGGCSREAPTAFLDPVDNDLFLPGFLTPESEAKMVPLFSAPANYETGPIFTVIGKGGRYEVIGVAQGAGPLRDGRLVIYRDMESGQMYYRTPEDFAHRMEITEGASKC